MVVEEVSVQNTWRESGLPLGERLWVKDRVELRARSFVRPPEEAKVIETSLRQVKSIQVKLIPGWISIDVLHVTS